MLRLKDKIEANVTYADNAGSATRADVANAVAWDNVSGKPSTFPPSSHTHSKSDVGLGNVDNTSDAKKNVATAGAVRSGGTVTAKTGTALYDSGLCFHAVYNNGYPENYGNCITLTATGSGELFCGWSGYEDSSTNKSGMARLYYRNKRDMSTATWSDWRTVAFTSDLSAYLPLAGGTLTGQVNFGSGSYYVRADGTANFKTVTGAVYNDYAEFFPRGEATEPGDIVALDLTSDHESYIKATATSKIVAGVHSDEYAMLIGGDKVDDGNYVEKNIEKYIPVSLCGRVFCKCIGKIHRGDTIVVSDIPGVGRAKLPNDYVENTQIVGYAVDEDMNEEIRRVRIRVKG